MRTRSIAAVMAVVVTVAAGCSTAATGTPGSAASPAASAAASGSNASGSPAISPRVSPGAIVYPSLEAIVEPTPEPAASVAAVVTPRPSPAPSPSPTPPLVLACQPAALAGIVATWEGGMGHRMATVTFTNTGPRPCTIRGTPRVKLVGADGTVLLDSATAGSSGTAHVSPGDRTFTVAAGGHLTIGVQTGNYCGATPGLPTHLVFALPKVTGAVRVPPASDGSDGVPPCLGAPGTAGSIETNGWAK